MRRELVPYYVSRAMLAILFGYLVATGGSVWVGLLLGVAMFAGFIWYAHSGWYLLELSTPLYPLRRDKRGEAIRDRALVVAVTAVLLFYVVFARIVGLFSLAVPVSIGSLAFVLGGGIYFAASFWLYSKQ